MNADIGFLRRWYTRQACRASWPRSLSFTDGRHFVVGTDDEWRERPAEWLPAAQRNTDAQQLRRDRRPFRLPAVRGELRRQWLDDGCGDRSMAYSPFTKLYAPENRVRACALHRRLSPRSTTVRSSSTSGRSTRRPRWWSLREGISGRTSAKYTWRVRPRPRRACLHHAHDPADQLGVLYIDATERNDSMPTRIWVFDISRSINRVNR